MENEIELIKKLQDKNISIQQRHSIFEIIVERYKNRIFKLIYNYIQPIGTKEDAEEITIEVFLRFYQSIYNFKMKCSFEKFLIKIAVNLSINFLKKKNKEHSISLEEIEAKLKEEDNTLTNIIKLESEIEMKKIVKNLILKLPVTQRMAIHLSFYEKMSYKEIADVMGTTVTAVESLLFRAKENLKKYILNNDELLRKFKINEVK